MADCLFCKIVEGKIPCFKIAETDKALAFMDIFPTSVGHCLVIPKQHGEKLHDIDEDSAAECGRLLNRVAKVVPGVVGADNYNVLQNNGEMAHQVVKHVHWHLIPKTSEADGLGVGWPSKEGDKEAIGKLADALKAKLAEPAKAA